MDLQRRLKECRKLKKVTQKDAAQYLGIGERSYQHYEYGEREPSLATVIKLAEFFNVSIDYLVGLSDNPERR